MKQDQTSYQAAALLPLLLAGLESVRERSPEIRLAIVTEGRTDLGATGEQIIVPFAVEVKLIAAGHDARAATVDQLNVHRVLALRREIDLEIDAQLNDDGCVLHVGRDIRVVADLHQEAKADRGVGQSRLQGALGLRRHRAGGSLRRCRGAEDRTDDKCEQTDEDEHRHCDSGKTNADEQFTLIHVFPPRTGFELRPCAYSRSS